jgi:predicted Zn-dependent protease
MSIAMTKFISFHKALLVLPFLILTACSTNQATGRNQFTGLMPASKEASIGAQEHEKILAQFGGAVKDKALRDYVTRVGQKIVPHTERPEVNYTFTLLDSPVVNAFALPGGYVYVTRGILMLANNEAELAAVIAHEIGHVTARHSAERYSTSVLTSVGASILSAAIKVDGASQALGLGANLYLSSYSRSQEHEADDLGIRYLSRAGYDTNAMAGFLKSLEASSALEAKETGNNSRPPSYLSTHPVTAERVTRSVAKAAEFPQSSKETNRLSYLKTINGMEISNSAAQGFVDNNKFIHPEIGFMFPIPANYKTQNSAKNFVAQSKLQNGGTLILTGGQKDPSQSLEDFLRMAILKGDMSGARDFGTNTINGFKTASVERTGAINNRKSNIRNIVYQWDQNTVYVLTLAMPVGLPAAEMTELQKSAFGFKRMSASDKSKYRPKTLSFRVAKSGDTIQSMSSRFPYNDGLNADRFRVINGMNVDEQVRANQAYKIIVQ